ncbi:MAG: hypothetical protein HY719_05205 [Planctomycetes bacterium]|nr:hypothetical protein [Planctomycetota bacterium]
MSFDLQFFVRKGDTPPTVREVFAYLSPRPNYEFNFTGSGAEPEDFDGVKGPLGKEMPDPVGEFVYENPDTGVYFDMVLLSPEALQHTETDDPAWRAIDAAFAEAPVEFVLNFHRPGFFAREALPEVVALADHFNLQVLNPHQKKGEQFVPRKWTAEYLFASWDEGNRRAVATVRRRHQDRDIRFESRYVPRDRLDELYLFLRHRREIKSALGAGWLAPRAHLVGDVDSGAVSVGVSFTEFKSQAFARPDIVFLQAWDAEEQEPVNRRVVAWDKLAPHLAGALSERATPCRHFVLDAAKLRDEQKQAVSDLVGEDFDCYEPVDLRSVVDVADNAASGARLSRRDATARRADRDDPGDHDDAGEREDRGGRDRGPAAGSSRGRRAR